MCPASNLCLPSPACSGRIGEVIKGPVCVAYPDINIFDRYSVFLKVKIACFFIPQKSDILSQIFKKKKEFKKILSNNNNK